jgi:uncharacterized protein (DUF952 family)
MILHISTREQWAEGLAKGVYRTRSLQEEGFIHCSKPEQILRSANEYYFGQRGLLLLCISVENLISPLIFEDSYNKGEKFPHIYGSLNLEAVLDVHPFSAAEDGSFTMPAELSRHLKLRELPHVNFGRGDVDPAA